MKRIFLVFFVIFLSFEGIFSQELNCRVRINFQKVKTTNQQIFQSLQKDIVEFMNTTKWTNYVFDNIERIDCDFLLTITDFNGVDEFKGTLQVSSTRPVYNTSLNTQIVLIQDKNIEFNYVENQQLNFNENSYTDELTSLLAFYAYIILGYDFDTFSEMGGTEFFQKAQKIVENAQGSSKNSGWKPTGTIKDDNRYYIAKNLNSPNYNEYRKAYYVYHRLGLDVMTQNLAEGRKKVLEAIEKIQRLYQKRPDSYLVRMFIETKRDEILGIYSEAPMQEAKRVAQIMKLIDPTHASQYDKLGSTIPKP